MTTILLSDPIVHAVRVRDNGDPLVSLPFAPGVLLRAGLAERLAHARSVLPSGVDLRVIEGSLDDLNGGTVAMSELQASSHRWDVGDEVELWLGDAGPVAARLKWVKRGSFGVEFDTPLAAEVLERLAAADPTPNVLPLRRSRVS